MSIPEGHMLVSTEELTRVTSENAFLLKRISELQQHATLREEQLRAYRRMECSEKQLLELKKDLEETTVRVLKNYGMEPSQEIPLPRLQSSGAI